MGNSYSTGDFVTHNNKVWMFKFVNPSTHQAVSNYTVNHANLGPGGSSGSAAVLWEEAGHSPFVIQANNVAATFDTDGNLLTPFIPRGVYMNTARIKHASITSAQIGSVNADTISTGTLNVTGLIEANAIDASKLNIDGSSITSTTVNGVPTLQLGSVNVNKLTGSSISATIMSGTTVYADNLTGDVSKFVPFRTTASTTFAGTETQLIEVQLPAPSHTDGHKPFANVTGWYDSRADKVYRVRMYMRNTSSQTGDNLGTPASAAGTSTIFTGSSLITVPAHVKYNGDLTASVSSGMTLTSGSKVGTVSAVYYDSNTSQTRINYTSTSGAAFTTSNSITTSAGSSYLLVGESRFKAKTGIAAAFSISGAMAIQTTASVYMKVTIQRYSNASSADSSTATDYLGELAGVLMGVR